MLKAAGGIIERKTPTGVEICVIFRERYGPEWGLPKGKMQEGESRKDASIREVKEETGCDVEIKGFVGTTEYQVGAENKVVYFWLMECLSDDAFEPSEEVKQMAWLPPATAIKRLSHEDERILIRQLYCEGNMEVSKCRNRMRKFLLCHTRRWQRLEAEISIFNSEMEFSASTKKSGNDWIKFARESLQNAEIALNQGDIDRGWRCLFAAQRMRLRSLDTDEEKVAAIKMLLKESGKIKQWRREAIEELLRRKDDRPADIESIILAASLRDEHYSNRAYVRGLLRDHTISLVVTLGLLLITFLVLIGNRIMPLDHDWPMCPNFWTFLSVLLFGLFGATLSAILKVPGSTSNTSIPELVAARRVTFLRIATGAGAALIVYIALNSQFQNLLNTGDVSHISSFTVYIISFAAGFSERLVLRVVGKIAGK